MYFFVSHCNALHLEVNQFMLLADKPVECTGKEYGLWSQKFCVHILTQSYHILSDYVKIR